MTFDVHRDLANQPAYRPSEAAHILALPKATVLAWCFGHDYLHREDGRRKRFKRVVEPADGKARLLSFANLCELHVLAVIRRHHGVTLPKVRTAIDYVRTQLGEPRPLASSRFRTNGVDLFVDYAGRLLNVSKQGQHALKGDFERALQRIEFGRSGGPVQLFPYTREAGVAGDQPRTVLVDPRRSFGRPVLASAFVRTEVINERFRAGDSIAEMAADYRVSPSDIEEALRFEQRQPRAA